MKLDFIKKQPSKLIIMMAIFVAVLFSVVIFNSFSNTTESSAWDGIVSTSFASGTGTEANPYVISNASELGYLKAVLESDNAAHYMNKNFIITNSINYGDYNLSINNEVPFTGSINGQGHTITNVSINNNLFNSLDGAVISNISFNNITYTLTSETGGVISNNVDNSTFELVLLDGDITIGENSQFGGIVYSSENSTYNNIVVNYNIETTSEDVYKFIYTETDDTIGNILIKDDEYNISSDENLVINTFTIEDEAIVLQDSSALENYETDNYNVSILNDEFILEIKNIVPKNSEPAKSPTRTAYQEHDSGIDGTTVYINDLQSDYDYYMGLNYTYSSAHNTPTMLDKGLYLNSNLVKFEIIYDGELDSNRIGTISYESGENQSKLVYFKYYKVTGNSIDLELIDNPFAGRPQGMAFNGWFSKDSTIDVYLDQTYYTWHAVVPMNGETTKVVELYASWTEAKMAKTSDYDSVINDTIAALNEAKMKLITTTIAVPHYAQNIIGPNPPYYYTMTTVAYGSSQRGYYNSSGNALNNNCRTRPSCTVYVRQTPGSAWISTETYYTPSGNQMYEVDPRPVTYTYEVNQLFTNMNMVGHFYKKTISGARAGYYSETGVRYTSSDGNCNNCTVYEYIPFYDANNNENIIDLTKDYYYLVTRDTNFVYLDTGVQTPVASNYWTNTKPFTLTSYYYDTSDNAPVDSRDSAYYNTQTYMSIRAATRIEYIRMYASESSSESGSSTRSNISSTTNTAGHIYGNNNNFKIGRGITRRSTSYMSAVAVIGGNNGTSTYSNTKYKLIVESGHYTFAGIISLRAQGTYTNPQVYAIFGSDYDRVKNDNSKLDIGKTIFFDMQTTVRCSTVTDNGTTVTIKSGTIGSFLSSTDDTYGIYLTSNSSGVISCHATLNVEGGRINNIIGGPGPTTSMASYNATTVYFKGGEADTIFGGGAFLTASGNRIIQVTGGRVNYSISGGSNGYRGSVSSGTSQIGTLDGDTYVYVGGTATIGNSTLPSGSTKFNLEVGSVFGTANGKPDEVVNNRVTDNSSIGSSNNAYVVVNGGTVLNNVYAGANYGATAYTKTSGTYHAKVKMLAGTVNGSVYGGGNNNGTGGSGATVPTTVDILGGTVNGSVYGGSKTEGTINGATTVSVTGGNITGSVYGGGEGNETRVTGNVAVTIGDSTANEPDITGNVYGGSAFGAVNTNSNNTVTVTVENGLIRGSVFGGGRGGTNPADNQSYTPYVNGGTITVTINDGDISKVYGGHDQAGSYSANDYVILNGGIIDEVYGGGNRSSVTTTNVTLNGSEVGSLYGGSNVLGGVSTANVTITSGEVGEVYGGNNAGGNCVTTIVHVEGTAEVTGAIYGGGKSVSTTSTMVDLYSATGGRIPNVYGGGYSAGVTTAVVNQRGASVGNLFGGSNYNGTVTTATITHYSGSTTAVYGGNNAGGNTITATIDYRTGSSDNIYGGGNQANGGTADITISGGTVVNVFGGGNRAGLDESQIVVTGGTYAIDNIYGGSDNSGKVDETHVTVETLSRKILSLFGGGKSAEVGDTEVIINNGIFDALYGGGHLAQATGDTLVDINGGTINGSMYGGGNYGVVKGSSTVTITDATIYGSAYAGGRGESATLEGSTSITIDGSTTIGTSQSVPPHNGSVFGGGDQAATGKASLDNSTSVVNIVSGTIYGNVYGGANTSVIYGNTTVNIGSVAVNQQGLNVGNIYIKGHIFGGGEANASGSEIYDWDFISVTQGTHINVNGLNHNSLTINGSFYGGGNAAKANGDTFLSIKNYGTMGNPKSNISIQRVNNVQINNSSVLLHGAVDRANDYNTELFSISRVDYLNLENNSELYLETGANLLKNFRSMDNNGNYARVTINENTNTVTKYVDNRLYMYEGKNLNIATDQQVTEYGQVYGMTFLGMFNYSNESVHTGIYHSQYDAGDLLSWSDTFNKGSYVLGSHRNNHNIQTDGFYSNFINEKTAINEVKYIEPTPEDALFYMWFIGENVLEYNVNIVASKYTTLGSIEVPFIEFTKPNTSFQILSFDSSEIAEGISLVDKNSIPRIASNATDANNRFGLSIEASNAGWLTTGKTNFYTSSPYMTGVTYYEGENSTAVPTMLFYLYHSKNVSEKKDLGTVRISVMTITKLNALTNEISRLVINVNMSTELYNTNEYEGSMTPGDKYELFASTTNNLTTRSKFSAYYSLYSNNNNIYRAGYHRALTSSFIFPEGTKITMLDFINGTPEYYYHVITAADVARTEAEYQLENECSYLLSMFTRMGSRSNTENYDDAAKNLLYYDGADSNEEFIFIVDFSDTEINHDVLEQTLLIEMRDVNEESIITVLGVERDQLKYNLYSGRDSTISVNVTVTDNPLYIGYSDVFDVVVSYQNSLISSLSIIDTQYFDSKLGLQLYLINGEGNRVSGTDLTGVYFQMDNEIYYPDITGITHIKMSDKVGNSEKWIIMNTANSKLATGTYQVVFECFGSADGIYYSNERPVYHYMNLTIINSTYGLEPLLDDNSVVFMSNNDKTLKFNIRYTSHLDNPNLRLAIYRRKYEGIYDTEYELVDLLDYVDEDLDTTNNVNEYLLMEDPNATNSFDLAMKDDLLTGTYRLAFRLYDENTMIGEVVRYIIIR